MSTVDTSPLEPLFHGNAALTDKSITAARANTPVSLALTALNAAQADEQRAKARAGGLWAAVCAYDVAVTKPDPAAVLDDMADSVTGIENVVFKALGASPADIEFADILRASITDSLWAFTAIERTRSECPDGYSYVFDLLADSVKNGGDPHIARQTALNVPKMIHGNAEVAR